MILLIAIMLSGCLEKEASPTMNCGGGETSNYEWMDAYQWSGGPMSYGNTTNWAMNNTSTGMLWLDIDIEAYFSEEIGPLEQGWVNFSVIQNGTVLWENQTSESGQWNVSIPVNTSQEVWLELRATGKDTHPDNDYGDYFISIFEGATMVPEWCE